jgi:hypothetical protein
MHFGVAGFHKTPLQGGYGDHSTDSVDNPNLQSGHFGA